MSVKAQAGKDFLIYIDTKNDGDTHTWQLVGGQRAGGFSVKADDIDASHKTSGGWKTSLPGLKEWSADLDGVYGAKDSGIAEVEKIAISGEARAFAFVYPDKTYRMGIGIVNDFGVDAPHDDVIAYKGAIKGQGPLSDIKESFTTEA